MEEKNLMKEILYLGAGLTAQGLNKMKSIVEHFSEANADARCTYRTFTPCGPRGNKTPETRDYGHLSLSGDYNVVSSDYLSANIGTLL